jgi:hypothetical protein
MVSRKGEHSHALALDFLRGLADRPGIEDEFAGLMASGQLADVIDAVEDALLALVEPGADVDRGVGRPQHRRR